MWSWQYYPISTLQQNVLIQPRLFMFSRFLFYQQSFAVSRNNEKSYYISVYVKFACDKNPRNVDFIKNTVRQNIGLITLCNILGFYTIIFLNRVYKCSKLFLVEMPIATNIFRTCHSQTLTKQMTFCSSLNVSKELGNFML